LSNITFLKGGYLGFGGISDGLQFNNFLMKRHHLGQKLSICLARFMKPLVS